MDKRITVCFTGHRQIGEATAAVEARVTEIAEALIQQGYHKALHPPKGITDAKQQPSSKPKKKSKEMER